MQSEQGNQGNQVITPAEVNALSNMSEEELEQQAIQSIANFKKNLSPELFKKIFDAICKAVPEEQADTTNAAAEGANKGGARRKSAKKQSPKSRRYSKNRNNKKTTRKNRRKHTRRSKH